ncbi:hypothetical protein [Streptomyces triticiradicis]|uniref:Uncharacterized protein n=1 Tax=Streptomyces triticiradicis TaxID=2651189 RepID=A0A7J5DF55_9ACTN|nr:hypothetical protein [Streptomyces triticiradicis]KAB1987200.1 hypothetical protein F8144_19445 [Streptomyces triticiradicis]
MTLTGDLTPGKAGEPTPTVAKDGELRTAAFPVRTVAAANKPIPRRADEVFQDRRSVTPMSR